MIPASNSNSHCVANQFFPLQGPQNLNYSIAMNQMNNMNNHQAMPQYLPFNSMGPSKLFNQNPNLGFPNQIQDINRLFQLQMFNLNTHVVPGNFNVPQNVAFIANSQPATLDIPPNISFCENIQAANLSLPQNVGFHMNARPANLNLPQNVAFVGNTQLGFIDPSGIVQNMGSLIASNGTPIATQQMLGSSSFVQGIGHVPPPQNQANFYAWPSKFQGSQRNAIGNNVKNNEKPAHYKNYKPNLKHEASGSRFMKPRFQKKHNSKGNFCSPNKQTRRGKDDVGARQISMDSSIRHQVEEQRSVTLHYTDKEIQQWREERRKNYPSKANIKKKLMEKMTKPEVFDEVAQLRRQQLKEILAKQAELGCEVAEIPSYYLSDSEHQVHEKKKDDKALSKKENFQNRFRKRGRLNKNDCFSNKKDYAKPISSDGYGQNDCVPKRKRLMNDDLVSHCPTRKREPTLLQKLLSADIKRDRHHLLQAFRFMELNSFFKYWPTNKLKFPLVIIKETESENDLDVGKSAGVKNSLILGEIEQPIGQNGNDSRLKNEGPVVNFVEEIGREEPQEEEGEIID